MKKIIYILLPFTLLANTPFSDIDKVENNKTFNDIIPFFEISTNDSDIIKEFNLNLEIGANYSGVGKLLYPLDSYNRLKIDIDQSRLTNINKLTPIVQVGFRYRF